MKTKKRALNGKNKRHVHEFFKEQPIENVEEF